MKESICASFFSHIFSPINSNIKSAFKISSCVIFLFPIKAVIPSKTEAAIFGIALIIGIEPTISSILLILIPAKIETIKVSSLIIKLFFKPLKISSYIFGFVAIIIRS